MNSGKSTRRAPCADAFSAKAVARFRLPSMSWSADCIWTTAIRNDLAAAELVYVRRPPPALAGALCGISGANGLVAAMRRQVGKNVDQRLFIGPLFPTS